MDSSRIIQNLENLELRNDSTESRSGDPSTKIEDTSRLKELQSDEEKKLLDIVDSLRDYGLGKLTHIPQLIVCGGQSTGKSSLLEAISGVPFPRNASLCTRFATELVLRRDRSSWIRVSIIPDMWRTVELKERLLSFKHRVDSIRELPSLIEKAKQAMGLVDGTGSEFSPDVLKVEVFGPTQPQLTIVDLPGLIQSTADGKDESDIRVVDNIVSSYMKNPRSIILAVIAANNDPANQLVLQKAKDVDPNGKRTLGVITKPDLISGPAEKGLILRYARNEVRAFNLGWHVIRNSSSQDTSTFDANHSEKEESEFFRKDESFKPDILKKLDIGIASLRKRLSKILFEQIQEFLPALVKDIESGVFQCKEEVHQLGPGRPTLVEQKEYLMTISQDLMALTRSAIRGVYDDDFFQDATKPQRKLCAVLMNLHENFANRIKLNGCKWCVLEDNQISNHSGELRTRSQAIDAATIALRNSKGRELPGLPGPAIIHELFVEYSSPWRQIGLDHIAEVKHAVAVFLQEALEYLGGQSVADRIQDAWLDDILDHRIELAQLELEKLLSVHEELPMTFQSGFRNKVSMLINNKTHNDSTGRFDSHNEKPTTSGSNLFGLSASEGKSKVTEDSNRDAAELAYEVMKIHYEISSNLYIDNVPTLAIWAPVIRGLPAILSPGVVFKMSDELILQVAGDSKETETLRSNLKERLSILEKGLKETRRHVSRSVLSASRNVSQSQPLDSSTPSSELFSLGSKSSKTTASGSGLGSTSRSSNSGVRDANKSTPINSPSGGSLFVNTVQAVNTPATSFSSVLPGSGSQLNSSNSNVSSGGTTQSVNTSAPTKSSGISLFDGVQTKKSNTKTSSGLFGDASKFNNTQTTIKSSGPSIFDTQPRMSTAKASSGLFGQPAQSNHTPNALDSGGFGSITNSPFSNGNQSSFTGLK